ncbi:MAG: biopolymer transporter ExbD [Alphaproteobacteria bacterium]|nr:biopolymer transporter ExbD [Alphaproteobacteria bacterium]
MAAYIQHGGGRRRPGRGFPPLWQINVTPFVDVMLVLLVVFMVTAPLLAVGVPVDLPKATAEALRNSEQPLTVSIDKSGAVYLQEAKVPLAELPAKLAAIAGQRGRDARIFVRGDAGINYGTFMEVMGVLNSAGFSKVALVTQSKPVAPAPRRGT